MVASFIVSPSVTLLDPEPPIAGMRRFIGVYVCRGEKTALIDVGPKAAIPNLLEGLKGLDILPGQVDYIILTHIHIDHAGGVGLVVKSLPHARVIAHPRAYNHLVNPGVLWQASLNTLGELAERYGEIEPVPGDRIIQATDQMTVDLGKGLALEIHLTPGHASHHLSILDKAGGILFAGEAAGVCTDGVVRPATPPPFNLADEMASLDRLIALKPGQLCYAHFGCYDSAVARLEEMKRQINDWREIIRSAGESSSAEDIFPLIRQKDANLKWLDNLSPAEYERERLLLINAIKGMMAAG